MAPAQTWNRRSFLQLVGLGGAALAVPATLRLRPLIDSAGEPCHPGAPVVLAVDVDAPQHTRVRLVAVHAGVRHAAPSVAAPRGARITLETPYPHRDLVAGSYEVEAELLLDDGAVLTRLHVGSYRVRPWRFSA